MWISVIWVWITKINMNFIPHSQGLKPLVMIVLLLRKFYVRENQG
jgi:hypothetical protein